MKDSTTNNVITYEFAKRHLYTPHREKDKHNFLKLIKRLGLLNNYKCCCICDWSRSSLDFAHMGAHKAGFHYTYDNIVPLCPNHHRQMDNDQLNQIEREAIQFFLWNISNTICPF